MSQQYMTQQRIKSQERHNKFKETCKNLFKADRSPQRCSQSTVSVTFSNIVNSSNDKLPSQRIFGPMNVNEQNIGFSYRYNKYNIDSCDAVPSFHYDARSDDSSSAKPGISQSIVENDDLNSESLINRDLRLKCEIFSHGDEENVIFLDNSEHEVSFYFRECELLRCNFDNSFSDRFRISFGTVL